MKNIIFGLGGFGTNLVEDINLSSENKFELVAMNEKDILEACNIKNKILLDNKMIQEVIKLAKDKDNVIVVNGLGGNSCNNLIQIITELENLDINLKVVCCTPFSWEGKKRNDLSNKLIDELKTKKITLTVFDNNDIKNHIPDDATMDESFKIYNNIIYQDIKKL